MDGTDRNLEIPTRGAGASTNKGFRCCWGGDTETLRATGDSVVGGKEVGKEGAASGAHTHAHTHSCPH